MCALVEARAETINGLYKAEVIHRRGPWKTREAVELATLEWVDWFNQQRLLEPIGYIPPAAADANYYRQRASQAARWRHDLNPIASAKPGAVQGGSRRLAAPDWIIIKSTFFAISSQDYCKKLLKISVFRWDLEFSMPINVNF